MLASGLSMARPLDYCVGRRIPALFKAPAVPAGAFFFFLLETRPSNPIHLAALPKSLVALGVRVDFLSSVSYTNRSGVVRAKPKTGGGFGSATEVAWCVTDLRWGAGLPRVASLGPWLLQRGSQWMRP